MRGRELGVGSVNASSVPVTVAFKPQASRADLDAMPVAADERGDQPMRIGEIIESPSRQDASGEPQHAGVAQQGAAAQSRAGHRPKRDARAPAPPQSRHPRTE